MKCRMIDFGWTSLDGPKSLFHNNLKLRLEYFFFHATHSENEDEIVILKRAVATITRLHVRVHD